MPHPSNALSIDCSLLVPSPRDAIPARVPLAVYSALARHIAQRRHHRIAFIGDGSTDGMSCLAAAFDNVSLSAVLLERAVPKLGIRNECEHLRGRAVTHHLNCSTSLADGTAAAADLYVWSQRAWRMAKWRDWLFKGTTEAACSQHFGFCEKLQMTWRFGSRAARLDYVDSFDVLHALRRQQINGTLPPTAEFAILLDEGSEEDAWTHQKLLDSGWMDANQTFRGDFPHEMQLCHNFTREVFKHVRLKASPLHVCKAGASARTDGAMRFHMMTGRIATIPARTVHTWDRCERPRAPEAPEAPVDADANGSAAASASVASSLRRNGTGVRMLPGLTAALLPNGTAVCGPAADSVLAAHRDAVDAADAAEDAAGRTTSTPIASSPPAPRRHARRLGAGLVTIFAHRQVATEFAASAFVMGLSSEHPLLRRASLLLVCTNAALPTSSLVRWLGWYDWFAAERTQSAGSTQSESRGLRLLVHTGNDLGGQGYSCGELYSLAASVRVWMRFPWVLTLSGPDVLALPAEWELLGRLMAHQTTRDTALLYDGFRRSKNDPLSYVEERFNMDMFVFFTRHWLVNATPSSRSSRSSLGSRWSRAAALCVSNVRNRPEAILHVVRKEFNLSVQKIGNRSRGSLIDAHKVSFTRPDAKVWHSHNMPAVLSWLQSSDAPSNRLQLLHHVQ
jgi:hypothetical protein